MQITRDSFRDTSQIAWADGRHFLHMVENGWVEMTHEYLENSRRFCGVSEYRECIGWALYHASVDVLLNDSSLSAFAVHRILDSLPSTEFSASWGLPSLACLCRSTMDTQTLIGLLKEKLTVLDVDQSVSLWPCVCSADCDNARRMCVDNSPIQLAIVGLNSGALGSLLPKLSVNADLPPAHTLFPLFRKCSLLRVDQQNECLYLMQDRFTPQTYPKLYAFAKFASIISDAKDGHLSALPVNQLGQLGREGRDYVRADGLQFLLAVATLPEKVAGRDSIFEFILNMIDLSDAKFFSHNSGLLFTCFTSQPESWLSQSRLEPTSPAVVLCKVLQRESMTFSLSIDFMWEVSHMLMFVGVNRQCCYCKRCQLWVSKPRKCIDELYVWLDSVGFDESKRKAISLLHSLCEFDLDEQKCLQWIADPNVDLNTRDVNGNTALHLASSHVILEALVDSGRVDFTAVNNLGETSLDLAIRSADSLKSVLLIERGGACITLHGIYWLSVLGVANGILGMIERRGRLRAGHNSTNGWVFELRKAAAQVATVEEDLRLVKSQNEKLLHSIRADHDLALSSVRADLNAAAVESQKLHTQVQSLTQELNSLMQTHTQELAANKSLIDELQIKIKYLTKAKAQSEAEMESRECTICMAAPWGVALMCGHCYCETCAENHCQKVCPTCNERTNKKFIRLFSCRKS